MENIPIVAGVGVGEGASKKATQGRCFCDVGTILSLD